ncbi:hypothetical protein CTAYLR_004046 [Chrysophaeum taylorii]|uniref:YkgJ family cysteine cluster protein n=1 Tax=Chrysophaeum taylorii TaxID=2483200 RepID=A0AAD7UN82_9STRA|nr:hypothetical protein CTAYLR_004046 [Chrysophaeum taylorii]
MIWVNLLSVSSLRFACTQCGDCCRVEGDVWLNPAEAAELQANELTDVRLEGGWRRLQRGEQCVLLTEENRCAAHEVRPTQCRAYPFWPRILRSPATWEAEPCEGISSDSAPVVEESEATAAAAEWAAWLRRFPSRRAAAVADTERWAQLVADLDLCPWARSARTRYVQSDATTRDGASVAIREAVEDLPEDNLAIVFVVFPDLCVTSFETFREIVDYVEDVEFGASEDPCLADVVQLAGFHPNWLFADEPDDAPIHFEKRAPHPTVSLVRASAIEGAAAATRQIAADNERTLNAMGTPALQARFNACRHPPSTTS